MKKKYPRYFVVTEKYIKTLNNENNIWMKYAFIKRKNGVIHYAEIAGKPKFVGTPPHESEADFYIKRKYWREITKAELALII